MFNSRIFESGIGVISWGFSTLIPQPQYPPKYSSISLTDKHNSLVNSCHSLQVCSSISVGVVNPTIAAVGLVSYINIFLNLGISPCLLPGKKTGLMAFGLLFLISIVFCPDRIF